MSTKRQSRDSMEQFSLMGRPAVGKLSQQFGRYGWFRAYSKTGAGGVCLKEGKYKNKSLMALGNVINRLRDSGVRKRGHIPYRDSKLTTILQPALGGNAKTSIICTVALEEVHVDETRGTLQFAGRAKCITNCVQVIRRVMT